MKSSSRYVVMYSGGIQAWHAALLIVDEGHAPDLLFADTRYEDEDLYRFLDESAADLGCPLHTVTRDGYEDGQDIWDEFARKRWIGNSRIAPCSANLKQRPCAEWLMENCDPSNTIVVLGHDWTEANRIESARKAYADKGWTIRCPNYEPPYRHKDDMIRACEERGIEPPRLYALGAPHNNCGGFCVRAGKGHMAWLYRAMPERLRYAAKREAEVLAMLHVTGSEKAKGVFEDTTLAELIAHFDAGGQGDMFDVGGWACFTEEQR